MAWSPFIRRPPSSKIKFSSSKLVMDSSSSVSGAVFSVPLEVSPDSLALSRCVALLYFHFFPHCHCQCPAHHLSTSIYLRSGGFCFENFHQSLHHFLSQRAVGCFAFELCKKWSVCSNASTVIIVGCVVWWCLKDTICQDLTAQVFVIKASWYL